MSKTITVDVVGPSHWAYMAHEMARIMKEVANRGVLKRSDVPPGILVDCVTFLGLVLEGSSSTSLTNPPASTHARVIALKALRGVISRNPNLADTDRLLFCCRMIVNFQKETQDLSNPTLVPAFEFMSQFFSELSEMGEEEII